MCLPLHSSQQDDASIATSQIRRDSSAGLLSRRASLEGLALRHVDDHPYQQVLER